MLLKECELKNSKDIIENNFSSELDEKFLKLYNEIKKYEKENKLYIMCLKLKDYLELLKKKLNNLEDITKNELENNNKANLFLKYARKEINNIDIKIDNLKDKNFE
ncbi:hypothetical protein FHH43_15570, partial [Clostridium perfringens]|nr:hypothetical protein [Clostridium perfringens]